MPRPPVLGEQRSQIITAFMPFLRQNMLREWLAEPLMTIEGAQAHGPDIALLIFGDRQQVVIVHDPRRS
ncbi:hypothetical protein AVEN_50959-1 [Araneus ventricosus]|uniref:Uncharacterized protein n=1 Tax=Araneus ventricosus TaxID=182803 RepID=A0A4Y2L972_ARAVE|nr:hypothetical protein AVEN_50959-1 [Araneus ventricosus]